MYILIGAGGHAKVVLEIAEQNSLIFDGFIDPIVEKFYDLKKLTEHSFKNYIMGIGGVNTDQLQKRHELFLKYKEMGALSRTLTSQNSIISNSAKMHEGAIIGHRAVVQAGAVIGENVIINSGTIIEHDVIIEEGSHIAPGAIVLGGAYVGKMCMIGAGSVLLPGSRVPDKTLVPALARYKNDK